MGEGWEGAPGRAFRSPLHTFSPVLTGVCCLPAQLQAHLWMSGYPLPLSTLSLIYWTYPPSEWGGMASIPHSFLPDSSLWLSVLDLIPSL